MRDSKLLNPGAVGRAGRQCATKVGVGLIRIWQYSISSVIPPSCRFQPSCSHYAIEAVEMHGPARGTWLALKRIARCHPFGDAGYDPVPQAGAARGMERQA